MRPRYIVRLGWLVTLLMLLLSAQAQAHNPDTSYARFDVSRTALKSAFIFDVTTLLRIVPDLDANGDHRLTPDELKAKTPVIVDFLRQNIAFEVNGASTDFGELQPVAWPPAAGDAIAEKDYHAATSLVTFAFHKPLVKAPDDFSIEFRVFDQLGPEHNVLSMIQQDGRAEEVIFQQIEPNYLYDTGYDATRSADSVHVNANAKKGTASGSRAKGSGTGSSASQSSTQRRSIDATPWSHVWQFFRLGVEHIWLGYDHVLFLLSLILIVDRFGQLVKIVTSFTVAHTITLILSALKIVSLPRDMVEIAIAATIIYTALENFWIRPGDAASRRRWMLAFGFGLIHGFGFAAVLRELGLPSSGLIRCLLSFNVGVEFGQLVIVAAIFPLATLMRRWQHGRVVQLVLSGAIALCGFGWLLDRALGLGVMPG